ncbi:low-density lipoprotein receptor-related protein 1B-like [Portunus trituberculatus]|uniref:low-density lipoprotein receptor-related protein 1B-like n=1 Tax=Portunus trituberculatus TaxID=210409 RepID=UPI001E1CCA77|nr:low-density lipoprotein receptor-related protein 1B-like [Portunus trituberculatus]
MSEIQSASTRVRRRNTSAQPKQIHNMKTCGYLVAILLAVLGVAVVVATAEASTSSECNGGDFNCGATCVPAQYVCDGHYDCPTGNDELDCPEEILPHAFSDDYTIGMDAPTFDLEFLR